MKHAWKIAALGTVAAIALAACGGKASTTATASVPAAQAPDLHALGLKYVQIVVPANAALETARPQLDSMPDSATGADFTRIMAPSFKAMETQDEALLRVPWPRWH
jgi:hypothetical protein